MSGGGAIGLLNVLHHDLTTASLDFEEVLPGIIGYEESGFGGALDLLRAHGPVADTLAGGWGEERFGIYREDDSDVGIGPAGAGDLKHPLD